MSASRILSTQTFVAWVPTGMGAYALTASALTILGWAFDLPRLTNWQGRGISMQPNTAIAGIAGGAALLFLAVDQLKLAAILGACMALIGGATLFEHITDVNLGIDTLLFEKSWGSRATVSPGRMGPPAATSFTILGIGLILASLADRRSRAISPGLGLFASCIALLSIVGYLFGADQLYTVPHLTGIAFQTATIILTLSLGLTAGVPDHQPVRTLTEDSAAGLLARRAFPLVVTLPIIVGWLCLLGQEAGLYDTAMGIALVVVVLIVSSCAVLGWGVAAVRSREEALRRSERELGDFFENAVVGLHWVGPDGVILRANQADMDLVGYSREEYVGRHIAEFHEDPDVIEDILARLHKGERIREYPARLRCKDGSLKDVLLDSSVLWDVGRFIHTRSFTRDVTDRKRLQGQLERQQREFATLVENSPDVIFRLDSQLRHLYINPSIEIATGLTPQQFFGKTIREAGLPEWIAAGLEAKCIAALATGQSQSFEFTHETPQGPHSFQSRIIVEPTTNNSGPTLLGITADLTELREAEAALKEADRRKDEFLATLAHELRNPLAPVRNSLEVMKRANGNRDLVESARATMERQIVQMVRLIDDLLDVSRITRNRLELRRERVELASVIHHAVETSRPLIDAAQHRLEITLPAEPIYLSADPVRLAQVFGNLLTNACKYTERGGRIWLTAERAGPDVILKIRDTGVGIPKGMLPRVFDMFTQVDQSLERAQGGLGIGLTLVSRIVELHGGTVFAESEGPGRGSEFIVRLPTLDEQSLNDHASQPNVDPAAVPPRRILVVDDNKDSALSLATLLELSGNVTRTAHDGVEAVEMANRERPDVILLDIGLPRMNGYDTCRAIREQPWGKDILMVALTGWGQEDDRRKSKDAGFDGHLVKPVDFTALTELLATPSDQRRV